MRLTQVWRSPRGKRLSSQVVETNAKALIEVVRAVPKDRHLCLDAFGLAEQLRIGAIRTKVYKKRGSFGRLGYQVRAHTLLVADSVRVQNRIKALLRSRGLNRNFNRMLKAVFKGAAIVLVLWRSMEVYDPKKLGHAT